MATTADRYELPVVIADSREELARFFGISLSNLASHLKSGEVKKIGNEKVRFVVIEIEDGEAGDTAL